MPIIAPARSPSIRTLKQLREAEAGYRRCPLYRAATQVVSGYGPASADLMLVGEQPGDRKDLVGKPFVGPAGRARPQIPRRRVFVTNAVKYFKHEMRGKRRLHKRPNVSEIERCSWWLDHELRLVKPDAVVALDVTAARSLLGRAVAVSKARQGALQLPDGIMAFVTIHPSLLLRIRETSDREREYRQFVANPRRAVEATASK